MRVIIKPGGLLAIALLIVVVIGGIVFVSQMGRSGNSGAGTVANSPVPASSTPVRASPPASSSPPATVQAVNPNNLLNSGEWKFYTEDVARANQTPISPSDAPAQPAYRFTVDQIGKKEWNIGFNHTMTGATFKAGEKVRLHFWARSPGQCLLTALMQKNLAPFPHCWKQDMRLTKEWKEYTIPFETATYADGEAILTFFFGHETGSTDLAGISLERAH